MQLIFDSQRLRSRLGLLSFTNFNTEQLSLKVGEVDSSVWLSGQLQFHENKILVEIILYALEIMF
jgi:hypothetical protein